ncbi:hypothetical protein N4T77_03985 [Clostridium sp. CX1]|nr:hypothetical protein [Clostridium sp. CX1]MCT8975755.1 hypothetical protein [Clostridium sp. CX1]
MNKQEGMDIQHAFKTKNNKPGSKAVGPQEAKAIRTGKQIVKSHD